MQIKTFFIYFSFIKCNFYFLLEKTIKVMQLFRTILAIQKLTDLMVSIN